MARRQIAAQLVVAPCADARSFVGRDIESEPAGGQRAGEFISVVERLREIARRVAFTAMRQRLGDIGPSVPLRALRGVRLKARIVIEEILIAVVADPGFLVSGDIRRIKRSERQNESKSAGIEPIARQGVAGPAIAGARQIFAALYDIVILKIR